MAPVLGAVRGLDYRLDRASLSVLPDHPSQGAVNRVAEVGRIDDQALLAAPHVDQDLFQWRVGDCAEGGADAAVGGIDTGDSFDVDDPVQSGDEVGQVVVGGAQEDRAFKRFVEQRREGSGLTVDRSCGALLGSPLDLGVNHNPFLNSG
jgi:hypothetical protein